MRADQVGVIHIGIIQVPTGLHLRLNGLNNLTFTKKLVIDPDPGNFFERLREDIRLIFVCRDRFRQDVDFHSLERRGGVNEPLHFRKLFIARQHRWLKLFVYPALRGFHVREGRSRH